MSSKQETSTAQHANDKTEQDQQEAQLRGRMEAIGLKLLVLSGKGGVGKSTVAANLAVELARQGKQVGLLDVDVHGPSIPRLMGLAAARVEFGGDGLTPIRAGDRLEVMSIGFLLREDADAVIWRGPLKYKVIRQFLGDVRWGQLDYLVVDCPPGTGDEPLAVAQLVGSPAAAVIVTTPQDVAISDVRRCVTFCRTVELPVTGIVENMSGFVCPHCGEKTDLFGSGGGQSLAAEMDVPFLGSIPIDPRIVASGDLGTPFISEDSDGEASKALAQVVRGIAAAEVQPTRP